MNGIHDMGGMDGLGPVEPEADEPVFHETWEGRVSTPWDGRSPAGGGADNWGSFRFALESLPPADYLRMSYYERWFTVHVNRLLGSDLVHAGRARQRLCGREPAAAGASAAVHDPGARVRSAGHRGGRALRTGR